MSRVEDFQKWIEKVMAKVIENLGSNVEEAQYELSESNNIIVSTLYYVCVKFKNKAKGGQSEKLFLVLKRPTQIEVNRQLVFPDLQFHNEILFYRTCIEPGDNFAKCFYTDERPPTDSIIVLENVCKQGYSSCPHSCNAPLEYILAAMREMGRFHAKGYVMKELQREKFFNIVEQIQETRYNMDSDDLQKLYMNFPANRAIDYLRNQGYDATFCDKMDSFLSNAYETIMMKTVEPTEPLSTICHGDFTLNNTFFKTGDDGQLQALLIDFALLRYSTPVIDLSTFLCLCCSNEIRKDKFFEIMRAYHDALKKYLLEAGIQNIERYSYEAFVDDFRRGALFGFVIASFYLAILMGYYTWDQEANMEDIEQNIKEFKRHGGEEISKLLADMLLEFKELGCLKHVL